MSAASNALLCAVKEKMPANPSLRDEPNRGNIPHTNVPPPARQPSLSTTHAQQNMGRHNQRESPTVSTSVNRLTKGTLVLQKEHTNELFQIFQGREDVGRHPRTQMHACQTHTRPATAARRDAGLRANRVGRRDSFLLSPPLQKKILRRKTLFYAAHRGRGGTPLQ